MSKIRVGVVGVGNCFAGLYQGIEYYHQNPEKKVIGIMHEKVGEYSWDDIEFVSAFDVGKNKIGKHLHEAVYCEPNLVRWVERMPKSECIVSESPVLDGVGIWVENRINPIKNKKSPSQLKKEILNKLRKTETEVIINYLPVGSQKATEFWARVALEAGCAFVNCIPVFIASDGRWGRRFERAGIPVVGDDIKGLVGATILHRTLVRLCDERGAKILRTYQINVGGNTDFINMKEQKRLESKKISKTESVQSQLKERLPDANIYVGPSDFIPFLGNTKIMFMRIEGAMWAGMPYSIDVRLEADDKANSAGIAIDAIRAAKIAMDRGLGGPIEAASAYLMKHPPKQYSDDVARKMLEEFISCDE
ncbi:MAG: inositol-3-phosphate synthase [Candidatus Anstonellales archaeon]